MPVVIRPQPAITGINKDDLHETSDKLFAAVSTEWCKIDKIDDGKRKRKLFRRRSSSPSPYYSTNKQNGPDKRPIVRHSFTTLDQKGNTLRVARYPNGFVDGIKRAYQQDLHLVLRPDDVWLAALSQFSCYVNGHSEELRGKFVKHEGKKELSIDLTPTPLKDVDMEGFALAMTDCMKEHLVDPELVDWLVPSFSTTTHEDRGVAAMVTMATMKHYFEFDMCPGCGFPSVTLLGDKSDWEDVQRRMRRFAEYGPEPTEWSKLLDKTLQCMIAGFDRPDDKSVTDFWMRVLHEAGFDGSGNIGSLSGWITAFVFWDETGTKVRSYTDEALGSVYKSFRKMDRKRLVIDGVVFPIVNRFSVPSSIVHCPIKIRDLGQGLELKTTIVAGCVGMKATSSTGHQKQAADTFQPLAGWWLLLDDSTPLKHICSIV